LVACVAVSRMEAKHAKQPAQATVINGVTLGGLDGWPFRRESGHATGVIVIVGLAAMPSVARSALGG
jgi:hypothetical protein